MNKKPLHYIIHCVVQHYENNNHRGNRTMEDSWVYVTEHHDVGYDMTNKEYAEWIAICRKIAHRRV